VYVRVNVIVEANLGLLHEVLADLRLPAARERELLRLADFFLPPRYEALFVDRTGTPVPPGPVRDALARPYAGIDRRENGTDQNLGSPAYIPVLNEVLGAAGWLQLVDEVRGTVDRLAAADPDHEAAVQRAVEDLEAYFTRRLHQLRRRRVTDPTVGGADEVEAEERLCEAMRQAVGKPAVRVDAVGAILLCETMPTPPEPAADGRALLP
jgi:hypothetical protein